MQQIRNARERLNVQGQWLQLGLLSASLLAPLVSRWNELRAMERTRLWREGAEERLQQMRNALPKNRRVARQQVEEIMEQLSNQLPVIETKRRKPARSSVIIWSVSVGVGVLAAGIGTYFLVRRRIAAQQEEAAAALLPFRRSDELDGYDDLPQRSPLMGRMADTTNEPFASDATLPDAVNDLDDADELDVFEPAAGDVTATSGDDVEQAAFVGNIRTLVYHTPDDENLPQEENRIYFASEEEAVQLGYHRARMDMPTEEQPEEMAAAENSGE